MDKGMTLAAAMLLGFVGWAAGADEPSDPAPETGHVETVTVQAYYLCDGYDTYGDASFYDCARRFFREAVPPSGDAQLKGTWRCVSAVNGPTANYEQTIKIGHYQKGRPGTNDSVDALLVQKIFEKNPSTKKMYRDHVEPRSVSLASLPAVVGKVDRTAVDWASTSWAYVQVAKPLRYFGGGGHDFYDTRAAFRFREGRLLIEHVAPAEIRERMWEAFTKDPRSTDARVRIREDHARGEIPTVAGVIRLADELVNDEIYRDGNPFRTEWTEQSLKSVTAIASYPPIEESQAEWSFPLAYSECHKK